MSVINEIIGRMIEACGVKNTAQMLKFIGVSSGAAGLWKKRGNIPDGSLAKVVERTRVSIVWLKTGEGEMRGSPPSRGHSYPAEKSLTKEEQKLLNSYRAATPEIQKAAGTMLENSAIESRRSAGGGSDSQAEKSA